MTFQSKGRQAGNKEGIGSKKSRSYTKRHVVIRDPFSLTDKTNEQITLKHLKRVEFVQFLIDSYDGDKYKYKMTYFMENGVVYKLSDVDVLNKT